MDLPATSKQDAKDANYTLAKRVTQVGTAGDFLLTVLKIAIGVLANSAALVAEGLHSAADLLFDLVVLVGMKVARKTPDETHPYGHGKFEGLTSIVLAMLLLGVAVGIVFDAAERIQSETLHAPGQLAFWVALFSIVTKEALFHYTIRAGKKLKSNIMIANAWHHRADSISSFAALVGIGGALLGWPIMDPIAAVAVAFFVSKVSFEIGHEAIKELTDHAGSVDEEVRQNIEAIIRDHPEVNDIHTLRARRMGPDVICDMHLEVSPFLSVSEGHQVAAEVRSELLAAVQGLTEVIVHVDVENDWIDPNERIRGRAPRRQEMADHLAPLLPTGFSVHTLVPHYTAGGLIVEVTLALPAGAGLDARHEEMQHVCELLLESPFNIREARCALFVCARALPHGAVSKPKRG